MNDVHAKVDVWAYALLLWERRWLVLLSVALIFTIAVVVSFRLPPIYESNTTLMIKEDQVIRPLMSGMAVMPNSMERLNMVTEIVLSRPNLEKLVATVDLDKDATTPQDVEKSLVKLRKEIKVGTRGNSLYMISYHNSDAELAQKVVNTLSANFQEQNAKSARMDVGSAYSFIEGQLELYRQRLEQAEQKLKAFKEKNLQMMPGGEQTAYAKMDAVQAQIAAVQGDLAEEERRRTQLKQSLSGEKPMVTAFATVRQAPREGRIAALEQQLSQLLLKYKEDYPEVLIVKRQLNDLRSRQAEKEAEAAADTQEMSMNPVFQQIKAELAQSEARAEALRGRLGQLQQQKGGLSSKVLYAPSRDMEFQQLTRDYAVNEQLYQELLKRREDARVTEQLGLQGKSSAVEVIDPPRVSALPVNLDRVKIVGMGFAASLVLSLGLALLLILMDRAFRTESEVESYLNLPVLATIPLISLPEERRRRLMINVAGCAGFVVYVGVLWFGAFNDALLSRLGLV